MTDEKFNQLVKIKEDINKLERNLKTIDYLLNSTELNIEITGTSTCEYKVHRHLNISTQDVIQHCLFTEKVSINDRIYKLKKEFESI